MLAATSLYADLVTIRPTYPGSTKQEYQNRYAFAALKTNGQVVTWGIPSYGGDPGSASNQLSSGVVEIFSANEAFAALKSNGSVITWGSGNGGDSSAVSDQLSSGVTDIFSTYTSFAALKSNGSVITWGSASGGDSSTVSNQLSSGITDIFSDGYAFAALKSNGSVVTWGSGPNGGDSSAVSNQLSSGVSDISSTGSAFAALKSNGSVVTWGSIAYGGDSSTVSNQLSSGVSLVYSTGYAFAALKSNGSVITWGSIAYGGDSSAVSNQLSSGVSDIFSSGYAFAAVKNDGSVVTWGSPLDGGDSSAVSDQLSSGVSDIFSTYSAFAALKTNGSVVTWGKSSDGGDSRAASNQLSSGVSNIFSTYSAFAALKTNGSVVTWGDTNAGADSRAVNAQLTSGVTDIFSTGYAFAALKTNASLVTWGNISYGGFSESLSNALSSGVITVASPFVKVPRYQWLTLPPVALNAGSFPITLPSSLTGQLLNYKIISGPASISGTTVTPTGTGTIVIEAYQREGFLYATSRSFRIQCVVKPFGQTIQPFAPVPEKTNGMAPFRITLPVSDSGLPVSVSVQSGPARIQSNTVTLTGAGTVILAANQDGNGNHVRATQITTRFTVQPGIQNLSIPLSAAQTFGSGIIPLKGTSSSGLPVTFSCPDSNAVISSSPIARVSTDLGNYDMALLPSNAPATVANFMNYANSGAYSNTIIHRSVPGFVIQMGGYGKNSSLTPVVTNTPVTNEFAISNTRGTVAMALVGTNPDSATSQWFVNLADNSAILDATNTNGNPPFTVFARVLGNSMTTIDTVASQRIYNIGAPFDQLPLHGVTNGQTTLNVENLVTVKNVAILTNTLNALGAGTYTLTAAQPGSANWNPAIPVSFKLVVSKASQTIASFTPQLTHAVGDANVTVITPVASSGLPVQVKVLSGPATLNSNNTLNLTGAGTVILAANQPGNNNYRPAKQVTSSFLVKAFNQSIAPFGPITGKLYGDIPFTVVPPAATSGLPVILTVKSGPATISGGKITITGAGTVTLSAHQTGNARYTAAPEVTTNFTVAAAPQTITFTPPATLTFVNDGTFPLSATATSKLQVSFTSGNTNIISISGNTGTMHGSGTTSIIATQSGNANWLSNSVTNTIIVR